MFKFFKQIFFLMVLLTFLVYPAAAQGVITITSVTPGEIPSNAGGVIQIMGQQFVDGAIVVLEEFGMLSARIINENTISAEIPANIPFGNYTLRVTNPDGSWANLFNALTVLPAQSTPIALTPAPTQQQTPSAPSMSKRPLIVIDSYTTDKDLVVPGDTFNLNMKLINRGSEYATNVIVSFQPGNFIPQQTGGVQALKEMDPGEKKKFIQPLTAVRDLAGQTIGTLSLSVSYGDLFGNSYSETFTIAINLKQVYSGVAPTETPTPTLQPRPQAQLIVSDSKTDISPLQPGTSFTLELTVNNLGDADAKNVSMVVGGATLSVDPNGTPGPGGVSGGSGELTNFAPLGTSNIQFIGDIAAGAETTARQDLIVNVATEPGAYPLKISFLYSIPSGERLIDDQVVTLLVFTLPVVDINFYRDPGPIFAGQANILPLQVVNLGKKSVVLGNMRITAEQADCFNNVVLVGALDAGGYFTLDANCIPLQPGPLVFNATIDYTDSFNHPQTYSQDIMLEILEQPPIEIPPESSPGENGEIPTGDGADPGQETFWQKVVRFFRGLFGLDSAPPGDDIPPLEPISPEQQS